MIIEINNTTNFPVNKKSVQRVVDKCVKIFKIKNGELSIAFISNRDIKKWNKIYRKIDKPTDVLSFGSLIIDSPPFQRGVRGDFLEAVTMDIENDGTRNYAEILISYKIAKKQAKENKILIKKEIERLLIHGILHLIGYDHEKDKDADEMEKMETQFRGRNI